MTQISPEQPTFEDAMREGYRGAADTYQRAVRRGGAAEIVLGVLGAGAAWELRERPVLATATVIVTGLVVRLIDTVRADDGGEAAYFNSRAQEYSHTPIEDLE